MTFIHVIIESELTKTATGSSLPGTPDIADLYRSILKSRPLLAQSAHTIKFYTPCDSASVGPEDIEVFAYASHQKYFVRLQSTFASPRQSSDSKGDSL